MSGASDKDTPRVPPAGAAWRDAQQRVADRNAEARKAGKEERTAYERKVAVWHRDEGARRHVDR